MKTDNAKEVKFMKSEETIERFWRKHQWMMPVCFILSLTFAVGTIAIIDRVIVSFRSLR